MEKISGHLSGIAAEYFVAAELARRGFHASLTLKNTPGIDILAVCPATEKSSCIQVKAKANLGKTKKWLLSEKAEASKDENYFYAFVDLKMKTGGLPDIYIVKAETVAKRIKTDYKKFVKKGGNDTTMREFVFEEGEEEKFQNWDILK